MQDELYLSYHNISQTTLRGTLVFHKMWISVPIKNTKKNFAFSVFDLVLDVNHIKIFKRTFNMAINRYFCSGLYLINEVPQNMCSINIYKFKKCSVT